MIRTINNRVRTLLLHASLPPKFWVEALNCVTYLHNILPSKRLNHSTPTTALFHVSPTYSHLRVFRCLCYPNISATMQHKLSPRSTPCLFLGYPTNHHGYRCLDLTTNKIILSRHVTFHETTFPFRAHYTPALSSYDFLDLLCDMDTTPPHFLASQSRQLVGPATAPLESGPHPPHSPTPSPSRTTAPSPTPPPSNPHPHADQPILQPSHDPAHSQPLRTRPMTRSQHGIHKPINKLNLNTMTISPIPKSPQHALHDPHWHRAMQEEFNALIQNHTWDLVPKPEGSNVIRCHWLFRHKYRSDGTLERYKARLIVNGSHQRPGIDYDETFLPCC